MEEIETEKKPDDFDEGTGFGQRESKDDVVNKLNQSSGLGLKMIQLNEDTSRKGVKLKKHFMFCSNIPISGYEFYTFLLIHRILSAHICPDRGSTIYDGRWEVVRRRGKF